MREPSRSPVEIAAVAATGPQAGAVRRVTVAGLVVNLALAGMKFVFGIVGHSQALVADAVHSISDMATDIAVLVGVKYWSEPADLEHPHGHGRIETIVSLFISVSLAAVGVGLVYNAVKSMRQGHDMAPGWAAFAAACVSVATKEGLFRWTLGVGHRTRSSAVTANAWHHRSDALSSIPVAVAVLAVLIDPGLSFLDHVAAVLVSALIIHAAWRIARPALSQLADRGATVEKVDAIRRLASSIAGVREVHALRTRYVGPDLQADLHVLVDPELTVREGHDIATAVKLRLLAEGPDVVDVLVHVEPFEPGLSRRGQDPHGATG